MATFDDVHRLAMALPEVTLGERWGNRTWEVGRKAFAWERPYSKADLRRFGGETPPTGPILAVRVADLHEKEAVLSAAPTGVFTIPHFDGYAGLLVQLERVAPDALRDLVLDAWLACGTSCWTPGWPARRGLWRTPTSSGSRSVRTHEPASTTATPPAGRATVAAPGVTRLRTSRPRAS